MKYQTLLCPHDIYLGAKRDEDVGKDLLATSAVQILYTSSKCTRPFCIGSPLDCSRPRPWQLRVQGVVQVIPRGLSLSRGASSSSTGRTSTLLGAMPTTSPSTEFVCPIPANNQYESNWLLTDHMSYV
jgi:hypothetical protein